MKKLIIFAFGLIFVLQIFGNSTCGFLKADILTETSLIQVQSYINGIYLSDLENVKNRTAGSIGEQNMATNLQTNLENMGLAKFNGSDSYAQEFAISANLQSQNVIGFIDNSSSNYVVLGAHYDSVYIAEYSYGYSDNISGVAGILSLAEVLNTAENLDFNVIVCFYGAEEVGCLGSKYFAENLPDEIKNNILLSINFDSIGAGDYLYYFHTDYATKYGNAIDSFAESSENLQKISNTNHFSTLTTNDINYSNLALNSDNSSFIKQGINSLSFFAGNLDATNGLGFFETLGHDRIMHNTDTVETITEVFDDEFVSNIVNTTNLAVDLLTSEYFTAENFEAGQVQTFLYSDWFLKSVGAGVVVILFVGFYIYINIKYKKIKK